MVESQNRDRRGGKIDLRILQEVLDVFQPRFQLNNNNNNNEDEDKKQRGAGERHMERSGGSGLSSRPAICSAFRACALEEKK